MNFRSRKVSFGKVEIFHDQNRIEQKDIIDNLGLTQNENPRSLQDQNNKKKKCLVF